MRPSARRLATVGLAGLAALGLTAGPALAGGGPSPSVSFSSSNDGASAGWSHGKGSPIDLTLGSDSSSTYAMVTFHHLPDVTVGSMQEPTFSTDNYSQGSPRFYLTLSNGDSLWGYPSNANLNGNDFAWSVNNGNSYVSWAAVQSSEGAASVTGVYVIADGGQTPGTTDVITGLQVDGIPFSS
jgi:hypothetical protein